MQTTRRDLKIHQLADHATNFVQHFPRGGLDRTAVVSCGDFPRVDCHFTTDTAQVAGAIGRLANTNWKEKTAFLDSVAVAADNFRHSGRRNAVWLLIAVTDGRSNNDRYFRGPAECGAYLRRSFNFDPTNVMRLVGVGSDVNQGALETLATFAGCGAVTVATFSDVGKLFIDIALRLTTRLAGIRHRAGAFSWDEVYLVRELRQVPVDVCLVLDRSGSMFK